MALTFEQAAELAGFFTAHAIWSVSDGGPLIPIFAHESSAGRQLARIVDEDMARGVATGRGWLDSNEHGADRAALVFDGRITLEDDIKRDALVIHAVEYGATRRSLEIVVPYRPADAPGGFAVHRPKFVAHEGLDAEVGALGDAFFRGVDAHEQGAKVWNGALDQSV